MADKKQGIDILFEHTGDITDDGKEKIKVMFEAAVSEAVQAEKTKLEEGNQEAISTKVEEAIKEIEKTVDEAVTYVAEQWMEDNKIAIDAGIKGDLVESFLTGMKELFNEHYVEIPEDKVDVVAEMTELVSEKDEELDSAIAKNLALEAEIKGMKKDKIIAELSADMIETDIERLKSLVEDIEFTDEETFTEKVKIVVESFLGEKKDPKDAKDGGKEEEKGEGEDDRSGKGEEDGKKPMVKESVSRVVDAISKKSKF